VHVDAVHRQQVGDSRPGLAHTESPLDVSVFTDSAPEVAASGAAVPPRVTLSAADGADALATRQAGTRSGGLLGKLGGGLMGGPLVAVSQLQAAGFNMAQIRTLGSEVLTYAREQAGDRLVREAAGSIPGLSGYL